MTVWRPDGERIPTSQTVLRVVNATATRWSRFGYRFGIRSLATHHQIGGDRQRFAEPASRSHVPSKRKLFWLDSLSSN